METILEFFTNLIIFTFGLMVLTFWVAIIFIVVDEIIDLVVTYRNRNIEKEEES